jgi:hypothetical protein
MPWASDDVLCANAALIEHSIQVNPCHAIGSQVITTPAWAGDQVVTITVSACVLTAMLDVFEHLIRDCVTDVNKPDYLCPLHIAARMRDQVVAQQQAAYGSFARAA